MERFRKEGCVALCLWIAISLPSAPAQEAVPDEVTKLRAVYAEQLDKINKTGDTAVTNLQRQYVQSLIVLQKSFQEKGELESLLLVKKEQARFTLKGVINDADLSAAPPELQALQVSYRRDFAGIPVKKAKDILTIAGQYKKALTGIQVKLTKAGNLDAAIAVKKEAEGLDIRPEVTAARFTVADDEATRPAEPSKEEAEPTGTMKVDLGGGVKLELVWIKPGKFLMGSPVNEDGREVGVGQGAGRETQHEVTITTGFWMGKYEVTQAQWERVMGNNPSQFKDAGKDAPVEQVSWNNCQEFLKKLNERVAASASAPAGLRRDDGSRFRLPSEAEWEYACRAGTKTAYSFGNDFANLCRYGNYREKSSGLPVGGKWFEKTDLNHDDGFKTTAPAGKYRANAWGLCDMHGNVFEWCQDWFEDYAAGDAKDPTGPSAGSARVIRGGSWNVEPSDCRSAFRFSLDPSNRLSPIGLRVVVVR